jgi:hypothetical protein
MPMNHLGKLCDCSENSNKKAAHLVVLFKSYKVNPNVSDGLHGPEEMHL